jgi:hypothetical protein
LEKKQAFGQRGPCNEKQDELSANVITIRGPFTGPAVARVGNASPGVCLPDKF